MNTETLKALNESIRHWQAYADGRWKEEGMPTSDNCALCLLFNTKSTVDNPCIGCPVMAKTKLSICQETPWRKVCSAVMEHGVDSPQFIEAAKEELEFLKSLIPSPS